MVGNTTIALVDASTTIATTIDTMALNQLIWAAPVITATACLSGGTSKQQQPDRQGDKGKGDDVPSEDLEAVPERAPDREPWCAGADCHVHRTSTRYSMSARGGDTSTTRQSNTRASSPLSAPSFSRRRS